DGVVNMTAGELCDDGNQLPDDGCTPDCQPESKRAFVSSALYNGNLGGLMGADDKCQTLADAAGLGGVWLAWISTAGGSPNTRFTKSMQPYVRIDGVQIADDWMDLTDGSLDAPLNVTELGGPAPVGNTSCAGGGHPTVWTATLADANPWATACNDFTSTAGSGLWGEADLTNTFWSGWCSGGNCSWVSAIYCFEQ
ncbi:MAG: hypothetical protein KC636_15890, partial [Myxococcales bacterium]|nr:hypothetical protein [Myxococcales bacterium]